MAGQKIVVHDDRYAAVDDGQEHLAGPVKMRVNDGFAVFDGKQQVTSEQVSVDPALAAQLEASGAAERVTDRKARKGR